MKGTFVGSKIKDNFLNYTYKSGKANPENPGIIYSTSNLFLDLVE
jgi:hypothetical protein